MIVGVCVILTPFLHGNVYISQARARARAHTHTHTHMTVNYYAWNCSTWKINRRANQELHSSGLLRNE